jgi:hypothetical protein
VRRRAGLCRALGIGLTVVALLAAPAAATARGGFDLSFRFPASNSYEISVDGYDATAIVVATKDDRADGRTMWSTYIVRGKVSPTAIHADLGAIGSAAMSFHPSGRVTYGKRHRGCVGADRYTTRHGVFVGSVRFRGEGGYSSATVHRVKGKVVTPRRLACRGAFVEREEGERAGTSVAKTARVTRLEAFLRSGLTAMFFSAARGHGQAGYLAEIEQTVGSLGIFRGVSVRAAPSTFSANSALSSATVAPPAPFTGSASFRRAPTGAKSWTGPLAVSFPGAPDVSLTDPRLKTQLTRGW